VLLKLFHLSIDFPQLRAQGSHPKHGAAAGALQVVTAIDRPEPLQML